MASPELESIGRVRSLAQWLRRSSLPAERYPKLKGMTLGEIADAKNFATGMFPWPARWTAKLFNLAKAG
jgi:hypothetical protein